MKQWFTGLLFLSLLHPATAQNDAVLASPLGSITSPSTGCSLTGAEVVRVVIFNAGPGTITAPFDISYSITGPVNSSATETELVASIAPNSTYTYTFAATADLSIAGTYSMDATVTVLGDPNVGNNTYSGWSITNNAASNGGTATGGTNVCITSNSGNITLAGSVGNVLNWEYSTDMGSTWVNISNTTISQSYSNIIVETWYRANVQNASCSPATSSVAILTVDPATVGGTASGGSATVCEGSNSGTISLSGHTGSVLNWEFTTDGGATWTPIANTTTSETFSNLTTTTGFRAVVQSGACVSATSTTRTINVSPQTVAGTVTSDATECSGSNSGTLTLSGHTGSVVRWQFSTNGGVSWTNIGNTSTTQNYVNLTSTRMYRAQVRSSPCAILNSTPATITVVANSIGGTVSSSATECNGSNQDTLQLSGHSGTIIDWESSTDGGTTWTSVGNTDDTLIYTNITATTQYRATVQQGTCPAGNSAAAIITIDSTTVGGTTSGATTVCASGNSGTVSLSGNTGSVTQWEFSQDNGLTWDTIVSTASGINFSNLTGTTLYRAHVKSGVCPADYSDTVTVTVDSITVGGSISANTTICSGLNSDTLRVTGHRGSVLNWEFSTDGGFTWINLANTSTDQPYNNITQTTQYRAYIKNGVCGVEIAAPAFLVVDPQATGGTLFGSSTVCSGSNSGTLTLIGYNSAVAGWESSTDGGATWISIANTTAFENYSNLTQTTAYRVIVSSGVCPNDTSSTAMITVDSVTVGGMVSADDTVCAGANSGVLTLSGQTGTVVNWEMSNDGGTTWLTLSNDSTAQNYLNLTATTSYRAKVKNGVCPAIGSAPATITVNPQSDGGSVSSSATVCEGSNFGILTLTGYTGSVTEWLSSTDSGLTWNSIANTGTTESYTNLVDTTWYTAVVQSGICTADTSTIAFINLYPRPNAGFVADTVCFGNPTSFTNMTTNSAGFITIYNWDFGDGGNAVATNPVYTYGSAGTYTVALFAMNNFGCTDSISADVLVNSLPVTTIFTSGPTTFCDGDTVLLSAPFNVTYQYSWNSGDTTFSVIADSNMTYTVTITDTTTGCFATNSEDVTVYPSPVADAGLDTTIDLGATVFLVGSGGLTYVWDPPTGLNSPYISNPEASPFETTEYILNVTDINGCTDSDTVVITVTEKISLLIHNLITPNGDGFNDVWVVENILFFNESSVSIFNRYGQLVYSSDAYDNTWDGTYNGEILPDGTYYYVLEIKGDETTVFKGAINIVSSN